MGLFGLAESRYAGPACGCPAAFGLVATLYPSYAYWTGARNHARRARGDGAGAPL